VPARAVGKVYQQPVLYSHHNCIESIAQSQKFFTLRFRSLLELLLFCKHVFYDCCSPLMKFRILCIAVLLAAPLFETLPLLAQPSFLRPDDEDFRILTPPSEVITWGFGPFAVGKASINTTTRLAGSLTSSPSIFYRRTATNTSPEFAALDIRPTIDYGLTFYAPILFTLFGRNIGINFDAYLSSYRFVTMFYVDNIIQGTAKTTFKTFNDKLNANNPSAYSSEYYPKFTTTLHYLSLAPILNISGFLLGANIGIPMPNMTSSLETPQSNILPLKAALEAIDPAQMQILIEPRIGIMAPLVSTRSGTLNFLATLGWMPPSRPPITSSSIVQRPNSIVQNSVQQWANSNSFTEPFAQTPRFDTLGLTPLSLSLGFNYIFTFGNAAIIEEFEREAYYTDSIRAVYAAITRKVDSLRTISSRLADSMANTIIVSSRLRDSLNKLLQARAIDSTNKAQAQRLFAAKTELDAAEAQRKGLEAQKFDLEVKSKQKDKEIAKRDRELAKKARELEEKQRKIDEKQRAIDEKQRLVEEKQRLIEETKKRVFEAKLGAITGLNEDGTETPENPTLRVEEFFASHTKVLLPLIVFDKGSAIIPARYKQINAADRNSYTLPQNPYQKSILLHGQLLNIIAKRMLQNASAQITLAGFKRDDEQDPKLALKRAEAVASYLVDRWKIPSNRIIRESGRTTSSMPDEPQAEATSVRISSDNASICAPYTFSDTTRTATPPTIAIGLDISSGAGLKQWQLEIRQLVNNEDELLTDTSATKIATRYLWHLSEDVQSIPRSASPVNIRLEAFDAKNSKAPESPIKELKIEQITLQQKRKNNTPDKTVFFYELLFDASAVNFLGQQNIFLSEIKSHISADSKIQITVHNPRGVSGNASDVAQKLSVDAQKATLVDTDFRLHTAQILEAAAYNNCVRIRIETPNAK
jgi:hypothetical protein